MVVILCIALAVSSIIKYGTATSSSEGFEGLTDNDKTKIRNAVEGLLGASSSKKNEEESNKDDSTSDENFESPKTGGNTNTKGNSISGNTKVSSSSSSTE